MIRKFLLIAFAATLVLTGMFAFTRPSSVEIFNALMLHDRGAVRAAADVAYGDGGKRKLDIYAPDNSGNGAHSAWDGGAPVLVHFYGGGWNSGTRKGYGFLAKAFAARGIVTVIPDYRPHPEGRYPGFLEDSAAVVAWVQQNIARFGGDPSRIFLSGHSAGAYNAAMLAMDPRWLQGAGVDRANIAGWLGLAGPYDFLPLDVETSIRTFSHVADLPSTQPINHASEGDPPAFIANGFDDTIVGKHHVERLAAKFETLGVPHTPRIYEGVEHFWIMLSIARPLRFRLNVLEEMVAFVTRWSGASTTLDRTVSADTDGRIRTSKDSGARHPAL
jgi:acetyl esterase/lipase